MPVAPVDLASTRRFKNPVAQWEVHAAAFGNRNKLLRQNQTTAWMMPSDKGVIGKYADANAGSALQLLVSEGIGLPEADQ